jgi:hypothetical protein
MVCCDRFPLETDKVGNKMITSLYNLKILSGGKMFRLLI